MSEAPARHSWKAWLLALLTLLACLGGFFSDALAGRVAIDTSARLYASDALYAHPGPIPKVRAVDSSPENAHQPWDAWIMASLRRGELPVWAPEIAFGLPLLANGQSAPFSPYKLLALWPTEGAWSAGFLLGRLALAGVGMLALAAYLGFSPWAGALGALAFMLNANFLNHLSFNDLHAYMALPWLLLLGERLRRAPDRRGVAMFGLGIGVTGLLGHPEAALYAAAAACLVLALGARADGWSGRRLAVVLGLAAGLGGLLTAVILLPFAEFLLQSTSYLFGERHAFLSTHTLGQRALHAFTDLLVPNGVGMYFDYYLGIAPALLAALGLAHREARRTGLALLGFGFACYLLFPPDNIVPTLRFAPNSFYAAPLIACGLALLATAGLDALLAAPRAAGVRLLGLLAGLLALTLGVAAWSAASSPLGLLGGATPYLLAVAAVLLTQRLIAWPRAWLGGALIALTVLDLGRMVPALVPPMPPFNYPETPILAYLKAQPGPIRVASKGALVPNTNLKHGIASLGMMDAFLLRRYIGYLDAVAPAWDPQGYQPDLLDVAAVNYVVLANQGLNEAYRRQMTREERRYPVRLRQARATVYENLTALPRARVLHAAEFLPIDARRAAARLKAAPARWREVALVETDGGRPLPGLGTEARPATPATITAYGNQHVTVEATLDRPGLLLLADSYYPGWVAEVDGRPADIHPVDVAFRGVLLGPGAHHVSFHYRPASVGLGLALSLLGLLLGVAALVRRRKAHQTIQTGQPTGTIR